MTSRKKHAWVLTLCILALALLITFRPSYGWRLRALLNLQNLPEQRNAETIAAQNEVLQAHLATLQSISAELPQNPQNEIRAIVLSQYPFGFENEILLNAGGESGVLTGKAVTFQGIFIGSISKVFSDSAVVNTVFNPGLIMPVRIGPNGVDALLSGGAYPRVTSIAKNASIANGDVVYTAAPGFPYGLPVARIGATSTSADRLFLEAALDFAYDVNGIKTVLVAR